MLQRVSFDQFHPPAYVSTERLHLSFVLLPILAVVFSPTRFHVLLQVFLVLLASFSLRRRLFLLALS